MTCSPEARVMAMFLFPRNVLYKKLNAGIDTVVKRSVNRHELTEMIHLGLF